MLATLSRPEGIRLRLTVLPLAAAFLLLVAAPFFVNPIFGCLWLILVGIPLEWCLFRSGTYLSPSGITCVSITGKRASFNWSEIQSFDSGWAYERRGMGEIYGVMMRVRGRTKPVVLPSSGYSWPLVETRALCEKIRTISSSEFGWEEPPAV